MRLKFIFSIILFSLIAYSSVFSQTGFFASSDKLQTSSDGGGNGGNISVPFNCYQIDPVNPDYAIVHLNFSLNNNHPLIAHLTSPGNSPITKFAIQLEVYDGNGDPLPLLGYLQGYPLNLNHFYSYPGSSWM